MNSGKRSLSTPRSTSAKVRPSSARGSSPTPPTNVTNYRFATARGAVSSTTTPQNPVLHFRNFQFNAPPTTPTTVTPPTVQTPTTPTNPNLFGSFVDRRQSVRVTKPATKYNSNKRSESPKSKEAPPERIDMDRKGLKEFPVIDNQTQLKLLNLQYNSITQINYLFNFPNLIFLDLYNNCITQISNLDSVPSLRVLMLGKNQISKIEGLDNLKRLDVLDLHSNSIQVIENIGHLLPDLRVLNLAGNKIRQVEGLEGLPCLTEVNLRRNLITKILCDLKKLPVLQRLFLSNNLIEGYSDIQSVLSVSTLVELSLDNNPISQESFYKATILETLPNLKHFDLKKINDDERPNREKKKPIEDQVELDTPITPMTGFIPNVPTQPAVTLSSPVVSLLPSQPPQTSATAIPISSKITPTPPTPTSSTSSSTIKINMQTDKVTSISVLNSQPLALPLSESTVEVTGTELHIYGMQVTSQEIQQAMSANTIESVHLHNLDFNNGFVDLYLPILKTSPKILSNLTFVQNNISNLSQLDRLPCQYVRKLTIRENPVAVMLKRILKPYCIMLCSNLEELNGRAITSQDRSNADKIFGRRNLIMEQHAATAEKQTSYTQNTVSSQYIDSVLAHTYTIDKKMKVIDEEWDSVIDAMIQEAIPQLENMDTHLHQYIDKYIK